MKNTTEVRYEEMMELIKNARTKIAKVKEIINKSK